MPNFKVAIIILLTAFLLTAQALPAFAVDYNVGVSEGQYVRYGNFVGTGPGFESFNNYDWQKTEITNIAGKEITLLFTGQLKDGTPTPGNGSTAVWNIELGTENGDFSTQGPIIAANLNEGDSIPPPNTYVVNRTETRTYLGTSRSVNVLDTTINTPSYTTTLTYVYDKASGMLLEAQAITEQKQPQQTSQYFYSVIETNIFDSTTPTTSPTSPTTPSPTPQQTTSPTSLATSTPAPPSPSTDLTILYLAIIAMAVAIIIVGILILRRRAA